MTCNFRRDQAALTDTLPWRCSFTAVARQRASPWLPGRSPLTVLAKRNASLGPVSEVPSPLRTYPRQPMAPQSIALFLRQHAPRRNKLTTQKRSGRIRRDARKLQAARKRSRTEPKQSIFEGIKTPMGGTRRCDAPAPQCDKVHTLNPRSTGCSPQGFAFRIQRHPAVYMT